MHADPPASGDRRFLLAVLVAGVALRLAWLGLTHGLTDFAGLGEATREALSVAHGRGFADPYFAGQGPSAHLLPVMPAIAGGMLALFGPGSVAGNLALLAWSLAQTLCAWLLLRRLFARTGASAVVQRWGLALLCLLPVFAPHETVDFRWWEGAASVCLMCLNLLLLLGLETRDRLAMREIAAVAGLGALTFFVSPPVGIAVGACWAVFALRKLALRQAVLLATAAAGALALLIAPWAIRNDHALGTPVLLRSNFGLELALANHPAAISPAAPAPAFAERLLAIHPYHSPAARAAVRAEGEVAYAKALSSETRDWIASHPAAFAQLYLRHLGEFFCPRPWQMYFTSTEALPELRALVISAVNLIGLLGLALGLRARRRGYWAIALCIAVIALPYGLVQPIPRYTWLVSGLLAFLAVEAMVRGLAILPSARRSWLSLRGGRERATTPGSPASARAN